MDTKKSQKCYVCKSEDIFETDIKLRDSAELKVLKCKNCKLEFLSSFDHIDDNFYTQGKMLNIQVSPEIWQNSSYVDDKRRFDFLKNKIKNKTLLDFGCGAGGFLLMAKEFAEVEGVEPNSLFEDYFKKNGLKIYQNADEIEKKFDFITVFHVFEHLKTPKEDIIKLSTYLNKNGQIIIEVPNNNDALLSLYHSKAFSDFTHWKCHLYYFSEKTIRKLFKDSPLKINYVKKVQRYNLANHLGWMIDKQKGGHLKYKVPALLDSIYKIFLKTFSKTDTLIVSFSLK